jgi:hypothetical protein
LYACEVEVCCGVVEDVVYLNEDGGAEFYGSIDSGIVVGMDCCASATYVGVLFVKGYVQWDIIGGGELGEVVCCT